ncbi:hypothetical protein DUNSADRAFT_17676 [Dunaliella salina]|uniref:Encoded protein n=1 Tax=Dunaliella salina TaxID=3046 RepID=A0ABQ7G1B5_DUNSA|nr:hypothetical protein DUNSADRAFT_17676 [Dunaliella salina]|eukprot:KAF5828390.1 hypothetical protein DUNSADRAFT_17676 [Dunaliella salina]
MRPSADIVAEVTQLIVLLPTAFSDMMAIPSCAPDALAATKATLAEIWGVEQSMVADLQCSMGGTITQRRRQLLAAPSTGPARRLLQAETDPCNAGAMICLDIQLAVPYSDVASTSGGIEGRITSFRAGIESNQTMKDSLQGFGQVSMFRERNSGGRHSNG